VSAPSSTGFSDGCAYTVLDQIETGEIDATIDAYGSVSFADDEPATVSKTEIDRALRVAQDQEQILRRLEREIARNKDYLQKVCA
jgi:COP9 signalosome complex subunit 3